MSSSKTSREAGNLVPRGRWFPYRPVSAALAIAPSVSVVIPALNEAPNLPHVFATLPSWVDEIVLVDGHSTDDTVAVARGIRPDIKIVTQRGAGKGDALAAGFAACSGDIIVMIDGDGSTDGREIVQFVSALVAGADFAKGSRFASGGGSDDITLGRRYGNRMLNVLVNRMFGTQLHRSVLRLQRVLGASPGRDGGRLCGVRGGDPDEHPGRQGRAADPGDSQPRTPPYTGRATCGR